MGRGKKLPQAMGKPVILGLWWGEPGKGKDGSPVSLVLGPGRGGIAGGWRDRLQPDHSEPFRIRQGF